MSPVSEQFAQVCVRHSVTCQTSFHGPIDDLAVAANTCDTFIYSKSHKTARPISAWTIFLVTQKPEVFFTSALIYTSFNHQATCAICEVYYYGLSQRAS